MVDDYSWIANLEFVFNIFTILISVTAVVYWIKLFRRTITPSKQDQGWMWFLASVLIVLLLNLSTQLLVISDDEGGLGIDQYYKSMVIRFVMSVSRTIMALSLTAGAYMLYDSMRARGDVKYAFTPVEPKAEPKSGTERKYELKPGVRYLFYKNIPANASKGAVNPMDLFVDLVTHDVMGFIVTRDYPPTVREKYNLKTTPIIWLTQDKGFSASLHPSDLSELSHVMKDFILKCKDTIILLDGIEYLILHNSFEDVMRMIQGLDDVVVQNSCRLIIVDPETFTEQQLHLMRTELVEFSAT